MNPALLLAEILSDPAGLGYAAFVAGGDDQSIADALNAPREDARIFIRIDNDRVVGAIDPNESDALTDAKRSRLMLYLSTPKVDFRLENIRNAFAGLFPEGSKTSQALMEVAMRRASRAEIIDREGARVYQNHVSMALRGV